jgi:phosphotriesterase-related protein
LDRREFLGWALDVAQHATGAAIGSRLLPLRGVAELRAPAAVRREMPGQIHTVQGPIGPNDLGITLIHEHVMVDFVGADRVSPDRYDVEEVFRVALPHLKRFHELGGRTLVECTPAYIGRDARLIRRLAEASEVRLLTNIGYYGAANDKYLPPHAHTERAEQLADRWLREWETGVDGTGIRPGFIKIGVDSGPLSDVDAKLVRAAARVHRRTGLTIASHTGPGVPALAQIALLEELGVSPSAWIWVHAQNERDGAVHIQAARRGAWVEFDGIGPTTIERHVERVTSMKREGLLDRVLVSHDAGWYHVGEPNGGTYRGYDTLFTTFLPALRAAGVTEEEVRKLLVENPRRALAGEQ